MLNLDTHILIHALNDEVTPDERRLLSGNSWGISAIVLWEIAKLTQLGRISIDMESVEFSRIFARVHCLAARCCGLPAIDAARYFQRPGG